MTIKYHITLNTKLFIVDPLYLGTYSDRDPTQRGGRLGWAHGLGFYSPCGPWKTWAAIVQKGKP